MSTNEFKETIAELEKIEKIVRNSKTIPEKSIENIHSECKANILTKLNWLSVLIGRAIDTDTEMYAALDKQAVDELIDIYKGTGIITQEQLIRCNELNKEYTGKNK